ncbi:MAG: hypothetical protein A2Y33_10340 [Spirochaetes bacterium GWF1_51_8]|nr:MAG: hypothetical protein A2Y33_10340 [Spirochaetes bacterium GWF1_51_8]
MVAKIGCCGAYCGTCKAYTGKTCKGCKLGYGDGGRNIDLAKCKIKVCCFRDRKLETCADCPDFEVCPTLVEFYGHDSYKYKKYREAAEFIRANGYEEFLNQADKWKGAYGKLGKE